jgi:hypothetical protein
MAATQILIPVFVQVLLTLFLLFRVALLRFAALKGREVNPKDVSLNEPNWPPKVTQVSNCFNNQFQLPVLFYAVIAFVQIYGVVDWGFIVLAWVFAVSRLMHAYFYSTTNYVPNRRLAYTIGYAVIAVMWVWLAVKTLGGF